MKQLSSFFLFLFFLLNTSILSLAQNPAHFILGKKHFANIDIYTLLYDDHSDILYIGTNSGIYAYKQNDFIELKGPPEQIGNSFFGLKQDQNGDIFCNNLHGQIFKVVDNKAILFHQTPRAKPSFEFHFFFVENNDIIAINNNSISKIDSSGNSQLILDADAQNPFSDLIKTRFYAPQQLSNGDIYLSISRTHSIRYRQGKLSTIEHLNSHNSKLFYLFLQNTFFILDSQGNIMFSEPKINSHFKQKREKGFQRLNEKEIIGTGVKKGLRFYHLQNDTLAEHQSFFNQEFISLATTNQNGTLFLGSFGDGIKVIPNKNIILPKCDDHLFLGITTSPNNEVFLSTRGGEIFQYQANSLTLIDKRDRNLDRVFYLKGNSPFDNTPHPNLLYDSDKNYLGPLKDFHQIDSNNYLLVTLSNILLITKDSSVDMKDLEYNHQSNIPNRYNLFPSQRYISVTWSPLDSTFYFANNYGVYGRHWASSKQDSILLNGQAFGANDLEFYNNQLICGTQRAGILVFQNKKFVTQIAQKHGLKSNTVNKILVKDNLLYILTKAGFQVYDLVQNKFLGLGVAEGLVNDEVTNFDLSDDKLWLMEKNSFYSIDIAEFATQKKENLIAKLYIDSILINGQPINHNKNNTFTYKENEVKIFFDYRDIESKTETVIQYTLDGKYDHWKTLSSTENKIEFQSLPIGSYSFKIKAAYRDQSTEPFIYSFEILPPIWQRWWFYVLLTILGVLISTIVFRSMLNRQRKELAIQNELNNSKLIAIRSQMNPHFIFNALNSIQHLVLKGDVDNSYSYINKFASLIRKTLEFSEEEFITLAEEINLIEVYLTLEKLRFQNNLEFEIIKPDRLDLSIPPMLIQPFIENAIIHGLLHKKGDKKLTIKFQLNEKLTCIIEDNGVGRAKAKIIKKRQNITHKSFSLKAIKRRFEILKNYYQGDLGYEYQDFDPVENGPITTRVILKIPFRNVRKN